ncbi:MATE family efflux transporter [Aestuariibius insulae]|uniref:MATE family efflux transporter n=1 Tax=Aestuariibius insulae TaxID=2058287 RepID=UPI00345E7349
MTAAPLSYRRDVSRLLELGLPLIGSQLAQLSIGITDVVMLGWYDIGALAAGVLGQSIFFAILLLGAGFAFAVMPIVATAATEGDTTALRRATRMGLWLSVGFSLLILPVLLMGPTLFRLMGQAPDLADGAGLYLQIGAFGMAPALVLLTMRSTLAGVERTKIVLLVTVASAVLNVGLNWVLIFGRFGVPELGLAGSALASVLVNLFGAIALVFYAQKVLAAEQLFVRLWRIDWEALVKVARLGFPIGLTYLSEVGLFAAAAVMVGWIGEVELAAHGVALQAASVTFMFHLGLSQAATIRAGNAYGRRDRFGFVRGAMTAFGLSGVFAVLTVLIFVLLPRPIAWIFLDSADPLAPAVVEMAVILIFMAALFQVADAAQVMALGLLRGLHDTAVPMWLAAGSYWGLGIPASYVLGSVLGYGAVGIWAGLVVGLGFAGALLLLRLRGRVGAMDEPDRGAAG